jgi:hypothetical protein
LGDEQVALPQVIETTDEMVGLRNGSKISSTNRRENSFSWLSLWFSTTTTIGFRAQLVSDTLLIDLFDVEDAANVVMPARPEPVMARRLCGDLQ